MALLSDIKKDLSKYRRKTTFTSFLNAVLFNQSFKIVLIYRFCHKYHNNKLLWIFLYFLRRHYSTKYGVWISPHAEIGGGFCISHCFSIMIGDVSIGEDCTLFQQSTLGSIRAGRKGGFPKIGNSCVVFAGAQINGRINLGDNVVVGANSVVTHDFESNSVIAGVPAMIINKNGMEISELYTKKIQ